MPPEAGASADPRREAAAQWARNVMSAPDPVDLQPASADASFRRYYRLVDPRDGQTRIVMDAPPAHEDCRPFVHVASLLADAGVNAPRVLAADLDQGFLLLTDLGRVTYLDRLAGRDGAVADGLYRGAIDALVTMQQIDAVAQVPPYDRSLLERELDLFPEWYLGRHLGSPPDAAAARALGTVFDRLLDGALAQPQVFVHRDYHSRNLMVSEVDSTGVSARVQAEGRAISGAAPGARAPGVLDFQDAVHGPISYDLVSLFKDAYIDWDEALIIDWVARYWDKARRAGLPVDTDFSAFYRDFEWMGVQRHLKVLGIFARLAWRDGKRGYLDAMPRVRDYLRRACGRYRELSPLLPWLDEPPASTLRDAGVAPASATVSGAGSGPGSDAVPGR